MNNLQYINSNSLKKEPLIITYNYDFYYVNNHINEDNFPIPNHPPPNISPTKTIQLYNNLQPLRDKNNNKIENGYVFTSGKQFGDYNNDKTKFIPTDRFYQIQNITINDESMLSFGGFFNQNDNNTVILPCNSGTGIFENAKYVRQSYPSDNLCIN